MESARHSPNDGWRDSRLKTGHRAREWAHVDDGAARRRRASNARLAAITPAGRCLLLAAPALVVGFADGLGIRHRADHGADFDLLVALNRGLLRAAAFLAPEQRDLRADLHIVLDNAERQHRTLVIAVAAEHR